MADWQDIATAPKDGTPIMVFGKYAALQSSLEPVYHEPPLPDGYAVVQWEPRHRCWACSWDNWPLEELDPIAWQALPAPPTEEQR